MPSIWDPPVESKRMSPLHGVLPWLLLLGLSFFFGLAFEEFHARSHQKRPGGIRSFPLLALAGATLYRLDPAPPLLLGAAILSLSAWLALYYWRHMAETDADGLPNVGLMVPVCNLLALLLGPIALAQPPWVAIGTTVAAVLLLTAREELHRLAQRIELHEIVNAGRFLMITGLVLPLLPNKAVTNLTTITPRQVWMALVVISTLSYASYLAQRYWPPAARGLWMAALGGLYSSTAMTVVLARQIRADPTTKRRGQAGITLATGIMYLRILVVVAVFNLALARSLLVVFAGLALFAFVISAIQYRMHDTREAATAAQISGGNPLELGAAVLFATLFLAVSIASGWATARFGSAGVYALAAIVGVTDIDPFVLSLAQGGAAGVTAGTMAAAILIAASSNNLLKAIYAIGFAGRSGGRSPVAMIGLAVLGVGLAVFPAVFTMLGVP